jgi:hypothetical protein
MAAARRISTAAMPIPGVIVESAGAFAWHYQLAAAAKIAHDAVART